MQQCTSYDEGSVRGHASPCARLSSLHPRSSKFARCPGTFCRYCVRGCSTHGVSQTDRGGSTLADQSAVILPPSKRERIPGSSKCPTSSNGARTSFESKLQRITIDLPTVRLRGAFEVWWGGGFARACGVGEVGDRGYEFLLE